jgi:transcriptional regulator with XRE-family HTH domain
MANRIKEVARNNKISYIYIAKELNVTPRTVSNWVNNKRSFNLSTLNALSKALKCQVHELLECGDNYTHAYSPHGEWLGLIKK